MKDVRPTSGRVLSAFFSILGEKVEGAKFLDLFAGTGRIGLEALKRGAASCVFVENVKARADELRGRVGVPREQRVLIAGREGMTNGQHSDAGRGEILVLSLEVRRAVSWLVKREMKFDVIFADPPYNSGWCEVLPSLQNLRNLFADDAVFVIEHSSRENFSLSDSVSENPNFLEIISVREYGKTCLTFLKAQE